MSAITGICTGSLRVGKLFFASTFHQAQVNGQRKRIRGLRRLLRLLQTEQTWIRHLLLKLPDKGLLCLLMEI